MKAEITLSPRELLYIAALLDATEFMGVSDAFFGMEEAEIQQEIRTLQASLERKGYAELDFDGDFALKEDVREMVDICANCDTFIVVDKNKTATSQLRELYYAKAGRIILIQEVEGANQLLPIRDAQELLAHITRDMEWQPSAGAPLRSVKVSNAVLAEAKAQVNSAKGANILVKHGCDALSAEVILDGLSEQANYYAVVITVFEGALEGVYHVMLLDTPKGLYKLTPMTAGDESVVAFDPLTAEQAELALSDVIRQALPEKREEFA